MWEAKHGMERRLKRQKWKGNLKRKIVRHNKEIENYAIKLCEQNWCCRCDEMEGGMSLAKTWGLLRHLLDSTNSKTQSGIRLSKARHAFEGRDAEFMDKLVNMYIGDTDSTTELPTRSSTHPSRKRRSG
ncbi:unnamed protein product [Ixodes pacificus]